MSWRKQRRVHNFVVVNLVILNVFRKAPVELLQLSKELSVFLPSWKVMVLFLENKGSITI